MTITPTTVHTQQSTTPPPHLANDTTQLQLQTRTARQMCSPGPTTPTSHQRGPTPLRYNWAAQGQAHPRHAAPALPRALQAQQGAHIKSRGHRNKQPLNLGQGSGEHNCAAQQHRAQHTRIVVKHTPTHAQTRAAATDLHCSIAALQSPSTHVLSLAQPQVAQRLSAQGRRDHNTRKPGPHCTDHLNTSRPRPQKPLKFHCNPNTTQTRTQTTHTAVTVASQSHRHRRGNPGSTTRRTEWPAALACANTHPLERSNPKPALQMIRPHCR